MTQASRQTTACPLTYRSPRYREKNTQRRSPNSWLRLPYSSNQPQQLTLKGYTL